MKNEHKFETFEELKKYSTESKVMAFDDLMDCDEFLLLTVRNLPEDDSIEAGAIFHGQEKSILETLCRWIIEHEYDDVIVAILFKEKLKKVLGG